MKMRQLFQRIKLLLRPYIWYEVLGVLLTIAYSVAVFLTPKVSEYLIDEVIPSKSYEKLLMGILMFAAICILQPLFGYFKDRIFVYITEKITYDIRNRLYTRMIHANFAFFSKVKGGDLISIIMNDGRGASDFISKIFATLLKNGLLIIMILIGMFTISWRITIVVLLIFLSLFSMNRKYGKKLQKLSANIQTNYDHICSCVNQTNNAILSIKINNQESSEKNKFETITEKMKKDNIACDNTQILMNNLTMVLVVLCLAIIYGWGAISVMTGELTVGSVIAMGLYFQLLSQPLFEMTGVSISTNVVIPIFDRIDKYLNVQQEKLGDYKGILQFASIQIKDLNFAYSKELEEVLCNINLLLPGKGLVCIVGESGSGKSTFTKLLMGMFFIESGHIFFGNKDINDITPTTLRRNISYVPQDCELLNDTFINNLCYGVHNAEPRKVEEICRLLRLHDKITSLSDGYNSIITEKANLSGGEKQRILIARAILKDTPIIILDEPLSALDDENISIVTKMVMELSKIKLIIMVTHYEDDMLKPDLQILFERGQIVNEIKEEGA